MEVASPQGRSKPRNLGCRRFLDILLYIPCVTQLHTETFEAEVPSRPVEAGEGGWLAPAVVELVLDRVFLTQ